jgi:chaperonin cofactor prefoldin
LKKDLKRMLQRVDAALNNPEAYLEPKTQRAFEGVRGHIAQLQQRVSALENKMVLVDKKYDVMEEKLHQMFQQQNGPQPRLRRVK